MRRDPVDGFLLCFNPANSLGILISSQHGPIGVRGEGLALDMFLYEDPRGSGKLTSLHGTARAEVLLYGLSPRDYLPFLYPEWAAPLG